MEFDSSSSKLQRMYNVLINFNGEDIRRKFVSHLDFSLSRAGFTTFLHEENVLKGMQLQEQQTQAKEMCLVAIVLFTKTYAESAWCLHELQQIIKCHETCCQHVLPVYYEIQPSDVRLQKGDFGKALKATAQQTFSGQQVEYALYRWSRALTKAANFFGWDESNYRSDAELVDKIVKSVLNLPILSTTKFPVGLQSHVENVTRMIENKASEVSIIGIWGMGGLGKTTIVKAIYNQIHEILNGCGLNAGIGIKILIKRNLIKVEKNNKLGMHPLLQVMGREIILQSSTQEFEKRYRLCFPGDLKCVVTRNVRREVIQGLVLKSPLTNTSWSKIPAFNVMNTLTVWDDIYEELTGDYPNLSKQLRWICHRWFPLKYIPENYDMEGVIAIDLKWSNLRLVWKEPRVLGLLKFLNLSHSKYLTETPDFSGLPSLEQLILKDCPRLCKVHQSIGDLCNLLLINLKDCTSLRNLPREVYKLKSLKTLILSGCSKIDIWEDDVAQMESLITLIAENKAVKQVPLSIVSSKCIGYISLRGFEGSSHNLFPSILRSWIPPMNPLCDLHPFSIDMEDNSSGDLVPFLSSLANLRCVLVQCDTEFQLRKQVEAILVKHGINFTELGVSKHHLRSFLIGVGSYNEFFNILSNSIFEGLASSESCDVSLPDDNRPYWLAHVGEGHSVYFTLPQDCYVKGMALCVVYLSPPEIMETECLTSVLIVNYTKCTFQIHKHGTVICFNDIDWEGIISNLGSGDKVEIFVTLAHGFVVKNTAVYLMCNEPNNSEMEPCKQPKENAPNKFIKKIVMCDFKLLLFFKNRK
ncbi:unnamed protein product [Sphenostylis stenocarpa]|uniref:TIR domain-containing protein n=1 Tax=Sphenostylis stenocarpa TaxID=92480 RepID=A0AA86VFY0_9FABA|nr:unnamed protein product [Sphenostylis stenocarpa]